MILGVFWGLLKGRWPLFAREASEIRPSLAKRAKGVVLLYYFFYLWSCAAVFGYKSSKYRGANGLASLAKLLNRGEIAEGDEWARFTRKIVK